MTLFHDIMRGQLYFWESINESWGIPNSFSCVFAIYLIFSPLISQFKPIKFIVKTLEKRAYELNIKFAYIKIDCLRAISSQRDILWFQKWVVAFLCTVNADAKNCRLYKVMSGHR